MPSLADPNKSSPEFFGVFGVFFGVFGGGFFWGVFLGFCFGNLHKAFAINYCYFLGNKATRLLHTW
jgi:hypothetical protein